MNIEKERRDAVCTYLDKGKNDAKTTQKSCKEETDSRK